MRHDVTVFVRIWKDDVATEREAEFVQAYGADGDWARLFALSDGYLGNLAFHTGRENSSLPQRRPVREPRRMARVLG